MSNSKRRDYQNNLGDNEEEAIISDKNMIELNVRLKDIPQ